MKKNRIKHIIITLGACSLAVTGCQKLDININPNNLSEQDAAMESLFPSAVMSTVGRIDGDYAIVGGMWAQFWAQASSSSQYRDLDSYNISSNTGYVNNSYSELNTGALLDLTTIITKAREKHDWRFYLMATTLRAYIYQVLVDLYDKVPYSEAMQGSKYLQPKFDDGYAIYKSLLTELDDALAKDFTSVPFSASQIKVDLIFGDKGAADFETEMANWKKLANTLKLKMYLRMVNVKPNEAEAGVSTLLNSDTEFLTVPAGVSTFQDVPNGSNPFYELNVRRLNTQTNLRGSRTLGSFLKANNDPRIIAYFGSADPKLMHQGDFRNNSVEAQQSAVAVQKATDPAWLFALPEVYFLRAEADVRYNNSTNAESLYRQGVVEAFVERGFTEAEANTLLSGPYAFPTAGTPEQQIEAIIVQKWVSLFGPHAIEAFFEKNRTGYPRTSTVYSTDPDYVPGRLVIVPQTVIGQTLPKRFVFPDFERSRNTNTPAEVPLSTPVWWAK
ncbi:SusD/RagB family nutrient-binding outer membrane lipoprotein [Mucilaginibacter limnophilus]|uniref:SusD/RagB family nutrient-binding outer membrane lipoprotein n=1 Tax=Mucilaginibacter limnophilus TaxID=1932778 RepID=A0A437MZ77_9SPHI|nr:SusD/RagB family nutrient-binding outer membrane lipoprotein [Mucilaginibacter limnophilus]RVU02972.1 SusD/RagB family nutrient-binding outer membrane lipoprotein [Mucilaginibacter limnophilus]